MRSMLWWFFKVFENKGQTLLQLTLMGFYGIKPSIYVACPGVDHIDSDYSIPLG